MILAPVIRRTVVTVGLAVAILGAGGTILAASQWTASEAPLAVAPVSIESILKALDQERARSAGLEQQLATLERASGDLSGALQAAQDQLTLDATTATDLRAALTAAQNRLTKLEAALKAAAKARAAARVSTTRASSGGTPVTDDGGGERDDD